MKVLLIAIFFATTLHAQTTTGWCSPIFINSPINAPLTINCNGVDPGIVAALKKKLAGEQITARDMQRRYEEIQQEINIFISQYRELEKKIGQYELLPEEKRRAEELLHDGKLDEAGTLFDQLIKQHHGSVIGIAQLHYLRAKIYLLQSDEKNTRVELERSHALDPDNLEYANDYGSTLAQAKQFEEARIVFRQALGTVHDSHTRSLEAQFYEAQITLNLGMLETERAHWEEAQKYLAKAIELLRDIVLEVRTPKYLQLLAQTLVSQGAIFADVEDYTEAEARYREAFAIESELATSGAMPKDQYAYSMITNANMKLKSGKDIAAAGFLYEEAIGLLRDLTKTDPQAKRGLAVALQNYGAWLVRQNNKEQAEKRFVEAVAIMRDAYAVEPIFNIQALADALGNLARYQATRGDNDHGKANFQEAIHLRQKVIDLYGSQERVDLAALAELELDLAGLLRTTNRPAEIVPHCAIAVKVYKKVALYDDADTVQKLGWCQFLLAETYQAAQQNDQAMSAYNDFVDSARNGVRIDPHKYQEDYGKALTIRARNLSLQKRYDDALKDAAEAEKIFRGLQNRPEADDEIALIIAVRLDIALATDQKNICQLCSDALKYATDADTIQKLSLIKSMCHFIESAQ